MSTVHMVRDPEVYPAPHTADVHPEEVDNYKTGGWQVAEANVSKAQAKKA